MDSEEWEILYEKNTTVLQSVLEKFEIVVGVTSVIPNSIVLVCLLTLTKTTPTTSFLANLSLAEVLLSLNYVTYVILASLGLGNHPYGTVTCKLVSLPFHILTDVWSWTFTILVFRIYQINVSLGSMTVRQAWKYIGMIWMLSIVCLLINPVLYHDLNWTEDGYCNMSSDEYHYLLYGRIIQKVTSVVLPTITSLFVMFVVIRNSVYVPYKMEIILTEMEEKHTNLVVTISIVLNAILQIPMFLFELENLWHYHDLSGILGEAFESDNVALLVNTFESLRYYIPPTVFFLVTDLREHFLRTVGYRREHTVASVYFKNEPDEITESTTCLK